MLLDARPDDERPWGRTALAALVLLCGVAALLSLSRVAPAVAAPTPVTDEREPRTVLPLAVPVAEPVEPMRRTGTNADGWATYRLAPGRVPDRLAPGTPFRGEISWVEDGLVRAARVFVPSTAPAEAPLVVSLHGLGTSVRQAEAQQRWSTLSKQQGFVVVWAGGHGGSWNAGPCCGRASAEGVDDLRYLDRLLQVTGALRAVDRRRVNLAGYSNGAMMAYRYACGRPGRITAVLAVAGTHTAPCRPSGRTNVLVVHGADDPTVPLAGTAMSPKLRSALPPARRAAAAYQRLGNAVRVVVLDGYAHGWPRAADGYDATGQGWRFFEEHPKR